MRQRATSRAAFLGIHSLVSMCIANSLTGNPLYRTRRIFISSATALVPISSCADRREILAEMTKCEFLFYILPGNRI